MACLEVTLQVTCAVFPLTAATQWLALFAAATAAASAAAGRARAMGAELPAGLCVCAADPRAAKRQRRVEEDRAAETAPCRISYLYLFIYIYSYIYLCDAALPEFPVSIKLRLRQGTEYAGALVIGAIAKHAPVSQTVYGAPAYYLDLWHSQVRQRGKSESITCNTDDIKQRGVTLEMCMDWLPKHGKDSNTSSNLGGVLKFSLNGKAIPQADLTIPAVHQPGTLLPWFGVYGRTESIECVEVEPGKVQVHT
eukprot:g63607.t1